MPSGTHGFVGVDEGEQFVAGDALRIRRPNRASDRAASMAALNFLPASLASSSRCCSRSSRNFRNMIHVSSGSRSRSPFSPLSLRMMSRADLRRLPSIWEVVIGAASAPFFFLRSCHRAVLAGRLRPAEAASGPPNSLMISAGWPWVEIGGTFSTSGRTNCASPCSAYFSRSSSRT